MLFDVKMEKFFRMLLVFYSFDFSFVSQNYYHFEKKTKNRTCNQIGFLTVEILSQHDSFSVDLINLITGLSLN